MATSMLSDTTYQQKRSKELIDNILSGKKNNTDYSGYLNELGTINPNANQLYGTNVNYNNANLNKYSANGGYFEQMQSKESFLNDLTTKISDMMTKKKEAVKGTYDLAYENEIGALERAKSNIKGDANLERRNVQATNVRQLRDLERKRAERGLNNGGEALSQELDIDIANEENANKIGIELMKNLGEIEGKQIEALRNKDMGIKNALAELDSEEAGQLLSAYKEAENYNMTKLNYDLSLAQTQEQIRQAILAAEERQKQFEEQVRQFNVQMEENKRQFNENLALQKKQEARLSSGGGSSGGMTEYQKATLEENKRQFDLDYELRKDPYGLNSSSSSSSKSSSGGLLNTISSIWDKLTKK